MHTRAVYGREEVAFVVARLMDMWTAFHYTPFTTAVAGAYIDVNENEKELLDNVINQARDFFRD